MEKQWFNKAVEDVEKELGTNVTNGLSSSKVEEHKEKYGLNELKEGKKESDIYVTGNTVIDALNTTISDTYYNEHIEWAKGSKLILVTAHRRENIGLPMEEMFSAIRKIVCDNSDVKVIYPIHKNPAVREIAYKHLNNHDRTPNPKKARKEARQALCSSSLYSP